MRRSGAAGAAVAGLVLVLGAVLAPSAGAQTGDLEVYSAESVARGIETTLAIRPHIIDPLGHVAAPFVRTVLNTTPQSDAIASVLWPGDLPHSVLGEGGTAPNQGAPAYPLTVQAQYPDKKSRERVLAGFFPLKEAGLTAEGGRMRAQAELAENHGSAAIEDLVVAPPGQKPIVSVDLLQTASDAVKEGGRIAQLALARAKGIELLDGMIRIDSIASRVKVVSDGRAVVEKIAKLEIGRVEVLDSDGNAHRAVIDESGIHIEDPNVPQDLNQTLSVILQQTLSRVGIKIQALDTTVTDDGANGQAFSGGLLIDFTTGGCPACASLFGLIPVGIIPDEVFAGIEQATTRCETMQFGLPVCFSLGLVPSASNSLNGAITIGSTAAAVTGVLSEEPPGTTTLGPSFSAGPSGDILGGQFTAPSGEAAPGGVEEAPAVQGAPVGRLFGLASEIPSGALVGVGAAFLLLAVGLVLAPSLRP